MNNNSIFDFLRHVDNKKDAAAIAILSSINPEKAFVCGNDGKFVLCVEDREKIKKFFVSNGKFTEII